MSFLTITICYHNSQSFDFICLNAATLPRPLSILKVILGGWAWNQLIVCVVLYYLALTDLIYACYISIES